MPGSQQLLSRLPSQEKLHPLPQDKPFTIGRDAQNDLVLNEWMVSKRHCQITNTGKGYLLKDLGSANGTIYRNHILAVNREILIAEGEVFWVASHAFICINGKLAQTLISQTTSIPTLVRQTQFRPIPIGDGVVLGRDTSADAIIPDSMASRRHCKVEPSHGGYRLTDLGSSNGTFYPKGTRLGRNESVLLAEEATFWIVDTPFQCSKGFVLQLTEEEAEQTAQQVGVVLEVQEIAIPNRLAPITFTVQPGKSVAIVGASGSGKSTLLKALTGVRPANRGHVVINGRDYYTHREVFRSNVGYVPQKDVMHQEITLEEALDYTARLRMPQAPEEARKEAIEEALTALDLTPHREKRVGLLSGGQQKRVNVAMELLTRPGLLYMDEPTSGLDPVSEHDFLNIVSACTQRGCTVIIVTHSEAVVRACDQLVVIGVQETDGKREGYLSYFGDVNESELRQKYGKFDLFSLCKGSFRKAPNSPNPQPSHAESAEQRTPFANSSRPFSAVVQEGILQVGTLVDRYALIMRSERKWGVPTFLLLFAIQAVVIPAVMTSLFPSGILDRLGTMFKGTLQGQEVIIKAIQAYTIPTVLALFLVLFTTMFGMLATTNEIVKEQAVYLRECLTNLQRASYLGSKLVVWIVLCVLHSVLLLAVVSLKVDFAYIGLNWTFFIPILAANATVCAIIGLAISAYSQSSYQAIGLACGAVFVFVVFSGIVPIQGNGIGTRLFHILSEFSPCYWSFSAVRNHFGLSPSFDIDKNVALVRLAVLAVFYLLIARVGLVRKENLFQTSDEVGRALG